MELTISRWGNSLAIRLPRELLRQLGELHEGDRLQVEPLGPARLAVAVDPQALQQRRQWLQALDALHERLDVPATEPVPREAWSRV